MKYSFESLDVWQLSQCLVKSFYLITDRFLQEERFGLTSQLRSAVVSVSINTAEGSTRWSGKEKARFYELSFSSLMEDLNQLILAVDLELLPHSKLIEIRSRIDSIGRMLTALYKSTKSINLYT